MKDIESQYTTITHSEYFTFTGKERDAETGYRYFGSRYLDHELIPSWLSVDPMADKYPSISPYAYCAWNPVKLVDPNGEDVWILSDNGELRWKKASKAEKIIYGSHSITNSSCCVFGHYSQDKTISLDEENWRFGTDDRHAEMYFEFFADHLNFEFSLIGYQSNRGIEYTVTTWLEEYTDQNGVLEAAQHNGNMVLYAHNHPKGYCEPSTPENHKGEGNDLDAAKCIAESSPNCKFYIYTAGHNGIYNAYSPDAEANGFVKSRFDKPRYGLKIDDVTKFPMRSQLLIKQ